MSLADVNKLTKFPIDKLTQLRDLYKADWPKHVIAYSTLQGFNDRLKNCTKDENKVQILCLNNDWESDGTFIILVREFKNINYKILILILFNFQSLIILVAT